MKCESRWAKFDIFVMGGGQALCKTALGNAISGDLRGLLFGSDANSIRNLCGPAGVRVYVCMWVC